MYFLLANIVMLAHLLLVTLLAAGTGISLTGRLYRLARGWQIAYLAAWLAVFLSQAFTGGCILTRWERRLWDSHAAGSAYSGSFFDNYFPFVSNLVNRYGLWIVLTGAAFQVSAWLIRRRRGAAA
jgi:hypothetical protein